MQKLFFTQFLYPRFSPLLCEKFSKRSVEKKQKYIVNLKTNPKIEINFLEATERIRLPFFYNLQIQDFRPFFSQALVCQKLLK